jgi:hypothetical protein
MLANDLTGQLARERVAEFHRQVECQRLVSLARTHRRGGNRGRWRGWRLLAGPGSRTRPTAYKRRRSPASSQ